MSQFVIEVWPFFIRNSFQQLFLAYLPSRCAFARIGQPDISSDKSPRQL
jgi:hypothetical protein